MATPYRDDFDAVHDRFSSAERELAEVRRKLSEVSGLESSERDLAKEVEALRARLDGLRRKRSLPLLERVAIASPCTADWSRMAGDDKVRFCGQCEKNVYNLSGMSREEAEQLVREREGNACVRMYKRNDGTVLTTDCPVGARKRRRRRIVASAIGGGLLASAGLFGASGVMVMGKPGRHVVMGDMQVVEPEPMQMMGVMAMPPLEPTSKPEAPPPEKQLVGPKTPGARRSPSR